MQYLLRLRRSVGHRQQNQPGDVLRVKTALNQLGYYDVGRHGLGPEANEALASAIREYQQQRGLKVDGQMRPGGPTEQDIESVLQDPEFDIAGRFARAVGKSSFLKAVVAQTAEACVWSRTHFRT